VSNPGLDLGLLTVFSCLLFQDFLLPQGALEKGLVLPPAIGIVVPRGGRAQLPVSTVIHCKSGRLSLRVARLTTDARKKHEAPWNQGLHASRLVWPRPVTHYYW